MTHSSLNFFKLMALADCYGSVSERISAAVRYRPTGRVTVELTEYVLYCLKMFESNGYSPTAHADEIQVFMWQVCPALALQVLGYPNSAGRWKIESTAAYLEIELDCR